MAPRPIDAGVKELLQLLGGAPLFFFADDGGDDGKGGKGDKGDGSGGAGNGGGEGGKGGSNDDLKALQDRLAAQERELKSAQEKLKEKENADLSAQQRAERERDEAQKRLEESESAALGLRVQVAAQKLGVLPEAIEDVAKLLDLSTVTDKDDPKAIERAVRALLEKKPHLIGVEGVDGGAGGGGRAGKTDMNALLRKAAGRS